MTNKQNTTVRPMIKNDWTAVSKIYADGIATGIATFEKVVPTYDEWNSAHLSSCRLIVEQYHSVKGWAALSLLFLADVFMAVLLKLASTLIAILEGTVLANY